MRKLFISDYSSFEVPFGGGAELCDQIILDRLDCDFIKSFFFENGEGYDEFIVSNFWNMPAAGKEWLIKNGNYVILEHDYKLFPQRSPEPYSDYIAPPGELINIDFFKAAKRVIFQSAAQKDIFDRNVKLDNSEVLGGSLWPDQDLDSFLAAPDKKNGRCFIVTSPHATKGQVPAISIAEQLKLPYDVYEPMPKEEFIRVLGQYSAAIFYPSVQESLGRTIIEAKMMAVLPITNEKLPAVFEPWYNFSREEIAEIMREKRENLINSLV